MKELKFDNPKLSDQERVATFNSLRLRVLLIGLIDNATFRPVRLVSTIFWFFVLTKIDSFTGITEPWRLETGC